MGGGATKDRALVLLHTSLKSVFFFWVRFCIQTLAMGPVLIQTIALSTDPTDRATLHELMRLRDSVTSHNGVRQAHSIIVDHACHFRPKEIRLPDLGLRPVVAAVPELTEVTRPTAQRRHDFEECGQFIGPEFKKLRRM